MVGSRNVPVAGAGERGGPSLLATLKLRVSRLEAALRDKEAELARLQSSTRVTNVNELRIQANTYYQEVVRLRNQLNISQHSTVPIIQSSVGKGSFSQDSAAGNQKKIFSKRAQLTNHLEAMDFNIDEESDDQVHIEVLNSKDEDLKKSVMLLHEENSKLRDQVTTLINTIQNSDQGLSSGGRDLLEKVLQKLEEDRTSAGTFTFQMRNKESEWQQEKESLKELINTLQDDRAFYKQTVSQKEEDLAVLATVRALVLHRHLALVRNEMEALRTEVLTLQQEVLNMKQLDARRGLTVRASPRSTSRLVKPGSGSSSDSTSSTSRHSRPQSIVRPSVTGRHPSTPSSRSSKASSEPRELQPHLKPPTGASVRTMTKSISESEEGRKSSSRAQEQLASSRRLASGGRSTVRSTTAESLQTDKRQAATSKKPIPAGISRIAVSSTKNNSRSASGTPTSSASSSATSRSNTSSASSSKTNSQKPTPVPSPTKVRNAPASSKSSTRSASTAPSVRSGREGHASKPSSCALSGRQSAKSDNSLTPGSPAKSIRGPQIKTGTPAVARPALQKVAAAESVETPSQRSVTERPLDNSTSAVAEVITEEDAHVLVELLRPEPHSSSGGSSDEKQYSAKKRPSTDVELNSESCVVPLHSLALHWDSNGGATDDSDSWGASAVAARSRTFGSIGGGDSGQLTDGESRATSEDLQQSKPDSLQTVVELPLASCTTQQVVPALSAGSDVSSSSDKKLLEDDEHELYSLLQAHCTRVRLLQELREVAPLVAIVESLDELKCLLTSHLRRQQMLNHLLEQEPQLMIQPSPKHSSKTPRRHRAPQTRLRHSPDGAEGEPTSPEHGPPSAPISPSLHFRALPSPGGKTASKIPQSPTVTYQTKVADLKSPTKVSPSKSTSNLPQTAGSPKKTPKSLEKTQSCNGASEASPGLVRQGTFSMDPKDAYIDKRFMGDAGEGQELGENGWQVEDETESEGQALADTLRAHLARLNRLREMRD